VKNGAITGENQNSAALAAAVLASGNHACAEGAIAAGCRFFGGYPITPSSEIAELMSKRLPRVDGTFVQMEDEIASIMACLGASFAGIKAMTATSGPGISLMAESIGLAVMMEVPLVIVTVMRGGPSTGQPTNASQSDVYQLRYTSHGDYELIVLSPGSVQEMYELTIRAFNLSERYRTPVILAADGVLGQMMEPLFLNPKIELEHRKLPRVGPRDYKPYQVLDEDLVPAMALAGTDYDFYATGLTHDEFGDPRMDPAAAETLIRRLCAKIQSARCHINDWESYRLEDATHVLLAYGINARGVREAVEKMRAQDYPVGMIRLKSLWPFPDEIMQQLGDQVENVVVSEMNNGMLIREVERFRHRFRVSGIAVPTPTPLKPSEIQRRMIEEIKN
jgi:2-oxoglutarate ferredoxin oxidoreductase subunit alpha